MKLTHLATSQEKENKRIQGVTAEIEGGLTAQEVGERFNHPEKDEAKREQFWAYQRAKLAIGELVKAHATRK